MSSPSAKDLSPLPSAADLEAAREAALACVEVATSAADLLSKEPEQPIARCLAFASVEVVGLMPDFEQSFARRFALATRGRKEIDRLDPYLAIIAAPVSWQGVVSWSYFHIAGELAARVWSSVRAAAAPLRRWGRPGCVPKWAEVLEAALPALRKLAALPLHELRQLIDEEPDRLARLTVSRAISTEWSRPDSVGQWAKVFRCHRNTMSKRLQTQEVPNRRVGGKYQIRLDALPAPAREQHRPARP
jgi:hypothetical protein